MAFGDLKVQDLIYEDGSNNEITVVLADLVVRDGSGNLVQADNKKFIAGTGSDLQIFHDGSHSYITNAGTGRLYINASQINLHNKAVTENMLKAVENAAVELYYDGVKKFQTASDGTKTTGNRHWVSNPGGATYIEAGTGATDNQYAYLDLVGDTTYTDYGLRLIRGNTGANTSSSLKHRGTGALHIQCVDAAELRFLTNNSTRWRIESGGDLRNASDSHKLKLGASDDLQIYHDGSNSYIDDAGTGQFYIRGGAAIHLMNPTGSEHYVRCVQNGTTELYFDGSKKLETTSVGATVTGELSVVSGANTTLKLYDSSGDPDSYGLIQYNNGNNADDVLIVGVDGGNTQANSHIRFYVDNAQEFKIDSTGGQFNDNNKLRFGNSDDLQIYHDGNNSYIRDNGTGAVIMQTNLFRIDNVDNGEHIAKFNRNASVDLYYDNSKKLETTSTGVNVTGALTVNGTALSAAPEVSLVADGAIAQHDSCIIQTDGKVSKVIVSSAVLGSEANGPDTATNANYLGTTWDYDNERLIALYEDANNGKSYVRMASLSGTTLTWLGTQQEVFAGCKFPCVNYLGNNRIVMTQADGTCQTRFATVNVGSNNFTIDATTKSWGSDAISAEHIRQDYDSANGVIGFVFKAANDANRVRACFFKDDNFSAVNDSYRPTSNTSCDYTTMSFDPEANRWVIIYGRSGTRSIVLNLNNSINVSNMGGEQFWALRQYTELDSIYHAPTKRVICIFQGSSNTSYGLGAVSFDVKGTIDSGTESTHSGSASNSNIHAPNLIVNDGLTSWKAHKMNSNGNKNFIYNSTTEKFMVSTRKASGSGQGGKLVTFTFNATNSGFTAGTESEYSGDANVKPMSLVLAGTKHIVSYITSGAHKYRVDSPAATNLTATNFIGFATAAISDTATGAIAVTGNTTTKSSLSAGSKYYVQTNGTLAKTAGNPSVEAGIALSSTKLLIKG